MANDVKRSFFFFFKMKVFFNYYYKNRVKVMLNWIVKKVGNHQVNPDLSTEKRIVYHRCLWEELKNRKFMIFKNAFKSIPFQQISVKIIFYR